MTIEIASGYKRARSFESGLESLGILTKRIGSIYYHKFPGEGLNVSFSEALSLIEDQIRQDMEGVSISWNLRESSTFVYGLREDSKLLVFKKDRDDGNGNVSIKLSLREDLVERAQIRKIGILTDLRNGLDPKRAMVSNLSFLRKIESYGDGEFMSLSEYQSILRSGRIIPDPWTRIIAEDLINGRK
jgi:hypothetical protein